MRAALFLSFFVEMNFSLTANVKHTVEQRLKTHTSYGLALIHSTCSSNRQFALKVTHATAPSAQTRFKNVIFRHHYVMQKTAFLLKLSNVAFAEFFTSTAKMQSPPNV